MRGALQSGRRGHCLRRCDDAHSGADVLDHGAARGAARHPARLRTQLVADGAEPDRHGRREAGVFSGHDAYRPGGGEHLLLLSGRVGGDAAACRHLLFRRAENAAAAWKRTLKKRKKNERTPAVYKTAGVLLLISEKNATFLIWKIF